MQLFVSDSAMLNKVNLKDFNESKINFIISTKTRTLNLPCELERIDGFSKEYTHAFGRLIFTYSKARASKDKLERDKKISKLKSGIMEKRSKFLKVDKQGIVSIDDQAIELDKKYDGFKAYLTDTTYPIQKVINKYNKLFEIEKCFRISKSDIKIRPVFHFKQSMIEAHVLISFLALIVARYLEKNTGLSIRSINDQLSKIQLFELFNNLNKEKSFIKHLNHNNFLIHPFFKKWELTR